MRKSYSFNTATFWVFAVVVGLLNAPVYGQMDLDTIINGISKSQSILFNGDPFVVRAQRTKSEVVTPSRFGGGYLNVEFLVAFRDGQFLCHKHFLPDETDLESKGLYTPKKPTAFSAKDGVLFEWQKSGPSASVRSSKYTGDMFQCLDYFRHCGIDVAQRIVESNGLNYDSFRGRKDYTDELQHPFLPWFLQKNRAKYSVNPVQEEVDGSMCWVVEYPQMDKFWVDSEHGFAIRRRVYNHAPGKPRKFEIWNKDLQEVKPGLWLPTTQIVDKYASIVSEDRKIWDKVASRLYYSVSEISVGSAPDAVFDLGITEGLIIDDSIRGIEYRVSKNANDPFGNIMYDARQALHKNKTNRYLLTLGSILIFTAIYFAFRANLPRFRGTGKALGFILVIIAANQHACSYAGEKESKQGSESVDNIYVDADASGQVNAVENETLIGLREGAFNWVPEWRKRSDCGPAALYVLMSLMGKDASLDDISKAIKVDPEMGCSISDVVQAAHQFDFDVESRFVQPSQVFQLRPPFILHGKKSELSKTGHFVVVVGFSENKRLMKVVDPVLASFSENPTDSVLQGYSGYVICPKTKSWTFHLIGGLTIVASILVAFPLLDRWYARQTN